MNTHLHKLARTATAVRAKMALSEDSVAVLACRHGVIETTARKWKALSTTHNRSHTLQKQKTTLSPAIEFVAVKFCHTLLPPMAYLFAITESFCALPFRARG